MAVYERTYKRYQGPVTPQWTRFLVLPRYAFRDVFRSRLFLAFFVVCFVGPVLAASLIYVRHNAATFLQVFPDFNLDQVLSIDAAFFDRFLAVQGGFFAFLLALFAGPGLVSRDLANNGLPLYLCRPFSRAEYLLGKFSVLAILLSAITWVASGLLFLLQGSFVGWGWVAENLRIAAAIFISSWIWITVLSLLALALSAWVRWKPVAGFLMIAVFFTGFLFGNLASALFRVDWAKIINLWAVMRTVRGDLFGLDVAGGVPVPLAWLTLVGVAAACLFLLHLKVRAYEVVS